jgi:hypothetical protein
VKNAHLRHLKAAASEAPTISIGTYSAVNAAGRAAVSRKGLRTGLLGASALRAAIADLHAEHVKLGGKEPLPELGKLTKGTLTPIARRLSRANAALQEALNS